MTYERAVGTLLQSSPTVRNSTLEVKLRRLDESDSRLSFIPGVTLRTRYYPQQPSDSTADRGLPLSQAVSVIGRMPAKRASL